MTDAYVPVTVWHLEMLDRAELRPASKQISGLEIREARLPVPEFNRFFYTAVGGDWYWRDRLSWEYGRWVQVLAQPGYETWAAWLHGSPAGYFELEHSADNHVEIAYFGLLPHFVGKGIGGALLTRAIERGWEKGANRVWVHTCSLDHPAALANYQARGLKLFKEETVYVLPLGQTPGPWPGANRAPAR